MIYSPISYLDIHIPFSVGDSAKNAFHSNPENTVFDAKRLIGRKMDDQDIARDMKHWPFTVSEKNGKPAITVNHKGANRDFVSYYSLRYTDIWLTSLSDSRGN
jgi:molecular chaperone DnaK (HSP70)